MLSIILLGPNGQVGFELARCMAPLGTIHCISRKDVDFTNINTLLARISQYQPDVIVNAAAWTAVDKAETEQEACFILNANLPEALAKLAQQINAWLVHYSSDYVYSGSGTRAWQETDVAEPLSVYGASKLAGDNAIQQYCSKYLIFRTSWIYAARGNNFLLTMLKLAANHDTLNVVADQIGAPTPAKLIAQITALTLAQALQQGSALSGIYHLTTKGETSWYDFAKAIFSLAMQQGVKLKLEPQHCYAISTAQYTTPAVRPLNSRLSLNKIEQTFNLQLPSWQSQLTLTFSEWQQTVKER